MHDKRSRKQMLADQWWSSQGLCANSARSLSRYQRWRGRTFGSLANSEWLRNAYATQLIIRSRTNPAPTTVLPWLGLEISSRWGYVWTGTVEIDHLCKRDSRVPIIELLLYDRLEDGRKGESPTIFPIIIVSAHLPVITDPQVRTGLESKADGTRYFALL